MTSQDTGLALSAVHTYFDGERRELLTILVVAALLISATALLIFIVRDDFTRGLFAVVLVFGTVFGAGAVSLLVRDVGLQSALASAMAAGPMEPSARSALKGEKARVAVVLSKFQIYRIAALVLAVLALVGMVLSRAGWVHGAAAGLLLVAASQAIIDHYSESRASGYLQRLLHRWPPDHQGARRLGHGCRRQ